MAEEGLYPGSSLINVNGYDPYRVYFDVPIAGSWRENRDPVGNRRYWQHVTMGLQTWSLLELVRLNGLEEFLLLGEWNLFVIVPEKTDDYEDLGFKYPIFDNAELQGEPIRIMKRGQIVAGIGMPKTGVVEIILPDKDRGIISCYGYFRFPPESGGRYLQRLPARMRNDDLVGMKCVTTPTWIVISAPEEKSGPHGRALRVTETRDPRSDEMGWLKAGTPVGLNLIEGTKALLGWVHGEDGYLVGGWISVVRLDGSPTLERVLEETDNMKMQAELAHHLKELEEEGISSAVDWDAEQELDDDGLIPGVIPVPGSKASSRASRASAYDMPKAAILGIGPPDVQHQRMTVTGGWRMMVDPIWGRPQFFNPIGARSTWGVGEVIASGGLDDLLLNRSWEICVVDPVAAEVQKLPDWDLPVFSNPLCAGDPVTIYQKGQIIIVQVFDVSTGIATVLLPSDQKEDEVPGTGYLNYATRDGRPLLRAMVAPVEEPDEIAEGQLRDAGEPPDGDYIEGPFFATPHSWQEDITVSIGQDIGSEQWARLPRGYKVREFEEILGYRARLPDIEGGGWVSLCSKNGLACFRKQPLEPPALELPEEVSKKDKSSTGYTSVPPIVWPGKGVIWPERPAAEVVVHVQKDLPELLALLGQGRAVCDWERMTLPPYNEMCWKSRYSPSQTKLHELLRLRVWKPAVVKNTWLHVREAEDERSRQLISLPRGSLVVTEWVSPAGSVRLLVPKQEDDPTPIHGWSDLGGPDGAAITLLEAGRDFWVEPWGGHLPDEDQEDENKYDPKLIPLREMMDHESDIIGHVQRGDGLQIAELEGRWARILHTKCVESFDRAPLGGWMEVFCEAGWSRLKARYPGEVHAEETRRLEDGKDPEYEDFGPSRVPTADPRAREAEEDFIEIEDDISTLPSLLAELGELETKSVSTRDWREAIDPVWGRRYFVNKWSGQVIHKLVTWGVAAAGVKLTLHFQNLSLNSEALLNEESPETVVANLEKSVLPSFSALADVPENMVQVHFVESDPDKEEEDSVMGDSSGLGQGAEGFRVIVKLRAPGLKATWASAGLKRAMANAENFTNSIMEMTASTPNISVLKIDQDEPFSLQRADLEEMDIPRPATIRAPPPPKAADQYEFADLEYSELKKNLLWSRPKRMQYAFSHIGEVNCRAIAEGLEDAIKAPHARKDPAHLEELSVWACAIGTGGAVSLASVLKMGAGLKLQTLLLDDNDIGAAGATALGAALGSSPHLREVGLSKNPIGKGFPALAAGLGASLVIFDISEASLDDIGAGACAACMPRWPDLRVLKLAGNSSVGLFGVEAVARAMLGAKNLAQVDFRSSGMSLATEYPRLQKILARGGVPPEKLRCL
mmetsp:Transcript_48249/g.87005  ORF Transcript_48249/g.87005 Transcript_48249/m.87005 type:complete len:1361 (-) Transcript_48249:172-4254(-)